MAAGGGPYISKWVTFTASAFIQASAGLSYSFSVYAPSLKEALGLSQTQVASVGSAVNLGGYFAILSGSIYDSMKDHHRLGPRLVVWLGCLCCFCGYLGMYLLASGRAPANFAHLVIFAIAAGNMGTWFDTSALVTNVRNFPNDRGFVVGVLKSFLGLSSSVYTTVYVAAFEPDAVSFLLMLAVVPPLLGLLLSLGLNHVPFVEASEAPAAASWRSTQGRFLSSFLMVGALALYQMATAVLSGTQGGLGGGAKAAMAAGTAALLGVAAALPLRCGGWRAAYAHAYVVTRESLADEEEAAAGPAAAGGPAPGGALANGGGGDRWQGRSGGSLTGARPGHAVAHHRATAALGGGSGSSSRHRTSHGGGPLGAKAPHRPGSSNGPLGRADAQGPPGKPAPFGDDGGFGSDGGSGGGRGAEAAPLLAKGTAAGAPPSPPAGAGAGAGAGALAGAPAPPPPPPPALRSLTTAQMLGTFDFWLLFVQFAVASGVCLSYLNNLGQLVLSLGGGHDGQVVFVSLFSVANAAGRLLMGYVPEQHLHSRGTPRTAFLTATAALTAASCLAVAFANLSHLYSLSILLGLAFGAHWSLLPAITSDLFGLKHFAANYTTLQFAPAAGSYLLATELTGFLYDRAAAAHGDPRVCIGPDCFREAFLLLSGLAALSSIACSVATSRSRRAYVALARHLHQVDVAEHGGDAAGGP